MKQFSKILKFELLGYLRNKVFVGITVALMIFSALIIFLPSFLNISDEPYPDDDFIGEPVPGGDGEGGDVGTDTPSEDTRPVMLFASKEGVARDIMLVYFKEFFYDYNVKEVKDGDEIEEAVLSGDAECGFYLSGNTEYVYYVNNLSMYDSNEQIASEAISLAEKIRIMQTAGLSPEDANAILSVFVTGEVVTLGKNQIDNFLYTYIMIFALYMVILLYGQMVATNVATEKSSRAMELLVTSADPVSMMFGKVLASCLAGLMQLVAVFGTALVFYRINSESLADNFLISSIFNIPTELFIYMLVFFVLGFLIYAFLYGAIGSTASKLEDINTSVMPITFLFIFAFMVVVFSMTSGNVDNTIIKVCSYIPFTSPMAMFTRLAMSTVAWYEILISMTILIGSVVGVGILAAKIYRMGVLMYGTPPKIKNIIKMLIKK